MVDFIINKLHDQQFMVAFLTAIAAAATVVTLLAPILLKDNLNARMKAVSTERAAMRQRERERLNGDRAALRGVAAKDYVQDVVDRLKLDKWLGQEESRDLLSRAGFRGQGPYVTFLFARLVAPIGLFFLALFYVFVGLQLDYPPMTNLIICLAVGGVGVMLPKLVLSNIIQRRQQSIKRAFPDSLDLLLICVESGMSIEVAFRRVAAEVGSQSIPLAEELTLTTAELSYLQDRRQAYENLAKRTDLDGVKAVCTALLQAERYGTPIGQTLRVMAQENRDMRMAEAEKKAAALPPKLTVPMIIFFLPVLFVVIMGPAVIRIMQQQ
jgi:tight adherence protein C